ncbi:MAG: GntR family transcriptional regulator [Bacteroidales bacterium]|nr:GntR family transcriptional regulator [Bacteroidales bacterium]
MIAIGEYNVLKIVRHTSVGLFLGDNDGDEVLLPNKYCPQDYQLGEDIRVFVYPDNQGLKIATNLIPKILLNEFCLLKVSAVNDIGAFMDWGLDKELLVPFKEQRQKLQEGRWYIIYLYMDEKTGRLVASNKLEKYLQNEELTVEEGQEVNLMVMQKTDMGFSVIVNHKHKGLIFQNEVFRSLNIGDKLVGYVKKIREDNKLDISLQTTSFKEYNDKNTQLILTALDENSGFIALTDKSLPEDIYDLLGISKKAFKKSIGTLYKLKKIILEQEGIRKV